MKSDIINQKIEKEKEKYRKNCEVFSTTMQLISEIIKFIT